MNAAAGERTAAIGSEPAKIRRLPQSHHRRSPNDEPAPSRKEPRKLAFPLLPKYFREQNHAFALRDSICAILGACCIIRTDEFVGDKAN